MMYPDPKLSDRNAQLSLLHFSLSSMQNTNFIMIQVSILCYGFPDYSQPLLQPLQVCLKAETAAILVRVLWISAQTDALSVQTGFCYGICSLVFLSATYIPLYLVKTPYPFSTLSRYQMVLPVSEIYGPYNQSVERDALVRQLFCNVQE